ncbi:MAG: hypothetical protein GEV07_05205 [Streptosporangiales bacterium]|nr:hypothetical protein [Streptosporangiales bacterium]
MLKALLLVLTAATLTPGGALAAETAPAERAASTSFTAMTWNIHFAQGPDDDAVNLDAVKNVIAKHSPTIVGLQEIHRDHGADWPDDHPRHPDEIKWMKRELPELGYKYFYNTKPGQMGKLLASKRELHNPETDTLPRDKCGKTGSIVKAGIEVGGTRIHVINTHTQAPKPTPQKCQDEKDVPADYWERLRDREVKYILRSEMLDYLNRPIVLMGDFNLRPDDPMKSVIANRGLIDTWTMVKNSVAGVTTSVPKGEKCRPEEGEKKVKRIDYVFASPAIVTDGGKVACKTRASDHKPVIMRMHVKGGIEISGSVRAGAKGEAGWAHLIVYGKSSSRLIVCDNRGGDWRVKARGYVPYQGDNFIKGSDGGSYRGMCQKYEPIEDANFRHMALKTCLKNKHTGERKDCRKHGMLERIYLGQEKRAGHVQYRVGVDNGVTVRACDDKVDGWTVRTEAIDGVGDVVTWATSTDGEQCETRRGHWSWKRNTLTTRTCLVKDGEEKGCKRKPMAYVQR